jgi:succinate dehydrogenase / fumarate reductase flavoprotein subunit
VLGEANFSDHGANRLGASALMQGLADGYFVIPYTICDFLAKEGVSKVGADAPVFQQVKREVEERTAKLLAVGGKQSPDSFHIRLGKVMWEHCGMARNRAGLTKALEEIPRIRAEFWKDLRVPGKGAELNQSLEKAGRVADFLEFAELMCLDALEREESCGGHFREEYQTPDGEAVRNDERFAHAAVWEWQGEGKKPLRHEEPLVFENVHLSTRSYK